MSVASSFLNLLLILCCLFVIFIPRERNYPEYQNVVFARKGRSRVGKMVFFCLEG